MKTTFGIKNFRVFDENGVDIELAPITILTGKNSAGKSSIVKAIAVLNSFLEQIKIDKENNKRIELSKYKIHFYELFDQTLGSFERVLNWRAKEHCITFEYTIPSTMLFQDIKVSFTFIDVDNSEGKGEDLLHYGVLSKFFVKTLEDEVIYSSTEDGEFLYNMNLVKDSFYKFSLVEHFAHVYLGNFGEEEDREKRKEQMNRVAELINTFDDNVRNNTYQYLRNPFLSKDPITRDGNAHLLISSADGKQIFQIPIIDECLAGLSKSDVMTKLDEIFTDGKSLDDAEQYVIKSFIEDVLSNNSDICEFWKDQESQFLSAVGTFENKTQNQRTLAIFSKLQGGVKLPNTFELSIGQDFWESYPGIWVIKDDEKEQKAKEIEAWKETQVDTFPKMYEVLMRLNLAYEKWMKKRNPDYSLGKVYSYKEDIETPAGEFTHYSYNMLCEYASRLIENTLFPEWCEHFHYISSTRARPKQFYTRDDGDDYYVLREYLDAKTGHEVKRNKPYGVNKKDYTADSFLNKWVGKDGFGIGKAIRITTLIDGAIILIKLIKEDGREVYLTDEGYGLTQLVFILISIETAILKAEGIPYNESSRLSELDGLNTHQFYYEQQTIMLEEPETHLHPDYQSRLSNMFASASEFNIHFIVETHSEYLIRKLQVLVADKDKDSNIHVSNDQISILYVNTLDDNDFNDEDDEVEPQVKKIEINEKGYLDGNFGKGFFDEAINRIRDLQKN